MSAPAKPAFPAAGRAGFAPALVLVAGLAMTFVASWSTGPSFDEERRVLAVRRVLDVFRALSDGGLFGIASPGATAALKELSAFGVMPGLLSAWFSEIVSGTSFDRLTALRVGWLLVTGVAPAALYCLVEPSRGPRIALLAAVLLLAMPRWTHAAGIAREPAVVASLWLVLLALYVRSLPPSATERRAGIRRRFSIYAVLFGVTLGFALATTTATLWVLGIVVVHYWATRPIEVWKAARGGRALVPAALLWSVLLGPLALVLGGPMLWAGGPANAAAWLFAGLSPTVEAVVYRGSAVSAQAIPVLYGAHWLLVTLPLALLGFGIGGAVVMVREAFAVRRGERRPDVRGLGALCLLVVSGTLIGSLLTPVALSRFPPRVEAALPFAAVAAAVGVEHLATKLVLESRRMWALLSVATVSFAAAMVGLPTASASFNLLTGGTKGAISSGTWTTFDGSELAGVGPAIDALRKARLSVYAEGVPRSYWTLLHDVGRLSARVDGARSAAAAELVVSRGLRDNTLGRVDHWGVTLWSVAKR